MSPSELEAVLRQHRPEPPASLRGRVLAAALTAERQPRWWARCRTWAAAAAVLLMVNAVVMADGRPPPPLASTPRADSTCPTAKPGFRSPIIICSTTPTARSQFEDFLP